jgi:hypothetical protein
VAGDYFAHNAAARALPSAPAAARSVVALKKLASEKGKDITSGDIRDYEFAIYGTRAICARCNLSMSNNYTIQEWNQLSQGKK